MVCSRLSEGEAYVGEIRDSINSRLEDEKSYSEISTAISNLKDEKLVEEVEKDSKQKKYYQLNWGRISDIFLEGLLRIYSPRNTWDEFVSIDLQEDENFREFYKQTEEYKQSVDEGQDEMSCFWIAELALAGEDRHGLKPYIEKSCRNYLRTNTDRTLNEMFQGIEETADSVLISTDSFGEKNPQNIFATIIGHTKNPQNASAFGVDRTGLTPFMSSLLASADDDSILEKLEEKYGEGENSLKDLLEDILQNFQRDIEDTTRT